jgi:hypothetical protein
MFRIDQVAIPTFPTALNNTTVEYINLSVIYLSVCPGMNLKELCHDVDTELSLPYNWVYAHSTFLLFAKNLLCSVNCYFSANSKNL